MADVLTDIDPTSLNVREALKILCFYLAQKSEPIEPHLELGFETKKSAFEAISRKFGRNPNTIKNPSQKIRCLQQYSHLTTVVVSWALNL